MKKILDIADEFEKYIFINFTKSINKYVKDTFNNKFLWRLFIRKYPNHIDKHINLLLKVCSAKLIKYCMQYIDFEPYKEYLLNSKYSKIWKLGLKYIDIKDEKSYGPYMKYSSICMAYLKSIGIDKKYITDNSSYYIINILKKSYFSINWCTSEEVINFIIYESNIPENILIESENEHFIIKYVNTYINIRPISKELIISYLLYKTNKDLLKLLEIKDIINIIYELFNTEKYGMVKYYIKYIMGKSYNQIKRKPLHFILQQFFIYVNDIRWIIIFESDIPELKLWALSNINYDNIDIKYFMNTKCEDIINIGISKLENKNKIYKYFNISFKFYNKLYKQGQIKLTTYFRNYYNVYYIIYEGLSRYKIYDKKTDNRITSRLYNIVNNIKLLKLLLKTPYNKYKKILENINNINIYKYFIQYCAEKKIKIKIKINSDGENLDIIKEKIKSFESFNYNTLLLNESPYVILYALSMGAKDIHIINYHRYDCYFLKDYIAYAIKLGITNFNYMGYKLLYKNDLLDDLVEHGYINYRELIKNTHINDIYEIKDLLLWYSLNP